MALISCQECGKNISDKAEACPSCGCPNKAQLITCEECNSNVAAGIKACPVCGCPIKSTLFNKETQKESRKTIEGNKKIPKRRKWLKRFGYVGITYGLIMIGYVVVMSIRMGTRSPETLPSRSNPSRYVPKRSRNDLGDRMLRRMEENMLDEMMPRTPTQIEISPMQESWCRPYCY